MIVSRLRPVLAAASACLAAALLAGCAAQSASDMDSGVASALQTAAQNVRSEAAAGHYAEALRELADIEREANDAAAQGKLSPARKQDVLTAVALVRTDLETASGARNTPSPTTTTTTPDATPSPTPPEKPKKQDKKNASTNGDQNGPNDN